MTHLWVRAEQRPFEERVGITPEGVAALIAAGLRVSVEDSPVRALPIEGYRAAGATIVPAFSWPEAPRDAIIFGLKELPEDNSPLPHRHIMFGHAFKGQPAGQALLRRFRAGGGVLYDLEYLLTPEGRRVAAFGYWAGYAGAAVTLMAWAAQRGAAQRGAAQQTGDLCPPVHTYRGKQALLDDLKSRLVGHPTPRALVIGALGRVGSGAADLCTQVGAPVTKWDMAETAHGGPFPEVLAHEIFLNCILAGPGCPVFVPREALSAPRKLTAIGDIACDPSSDFSPVKVYDRVTDWAAPVIRVADDPVLDVMAIDNLPSLLPVESSLDYAAQLLPALQGLTEIETGIWGRAKAIYDDNLARLSD